MTFMSVGYDNSWSLERWAAQFRIKITRREKDLLEFEMINVDPSITNALRRILISEVPTVAIEHVFVIDNTSEMADEVLSHRLGLVPLTVDAEDLKDRGDTATEQNTVVFKLHVQCKRVCLICCELTHACHKECDTSEMADEVLSHCLGLVALTGTRKT
jgi:DNA-directed RNA polymerase I and III subunit RPAC1